MRVAFIFFKGLDGCGVQRFAEVHRDWLRANNHTCDFFAFKNSFSRAAKGRDKSIVMFDETDVREAMHRANDYDIVMINSYPTTKFTMEAIKACYLALEQEVTRPIKVAMMHEIMPLNYNKVPCLPLFLNQGDVIVTFDPEVPFVDDIRRTMPELLPRVSGYTIPFNEDEADRIFAETTATPFDAKDNRLTYIGRYSTIKDPNRLFQIQSILNARNDPRALWLSMVGVEKSLAYSEYVKKKEAGHYNQIIPTNNWFAGFQDGLHEAGKVAIYGLYQRSTIFKDVLDRSKFGCSFYSRSDRDVKSYGNRMEYTMLELCCATVPVFDAHWAKHNRTQNIEGNPLFSELPKFSVLIDKTDMMAGTDELLEIRDNPRAASQLRHNALAVVKEENGSSNVLPRFYDRILGFGKRTDGLDKNDLARRMINGKFDPELPAVSFNTIGQVTELSTSESGRVSVKPRDLTRRIF